MANSVDPDQTAPLGPVTSKTKDHYGTSIIPALLIAYVAEQDDSSYSWS